MKNDTVRNHRLTRMAAALAAALSLGAASAHALPLVAQTTFGGVGNETGTAVAVNASGVYFTGHSNDSTQGVIGQFGTGLGSSPLWIHSWSGPGDVSFFNAIALTNAAVIAAGRTFRHSTDTVGAKEGKGDTSAFHADGSLGPGVGGSIWTRQTPAAPGGFPYGGHEWITRMTPASESGQTVLYTAGIGERIGFTNQWGVFVTKLDEAGNVLWSRNDMSPTVVTNATAPAITATGDSVYVASRNDASGMHPYLKKYGPDGSLQWSQISGVTGEYLGVTTAGGKVYAVGRTGGANPDFLVESWDGAGTLLWSKTYDRSAAEDELTSVVFVDGHLYAVGSTRGGTAGGSDGILLAIDALGGTLLETTLWGGTANDSFNDLARAGSILYAIGSTSSFGAGGSDGAIIGFALPSASAPEPGTLALAVLGFLGIAGMRKGRERRGS